jgi:two-component sensor histidine kinase
MLTVIDGDLSRSPASLVSREEAEHRIANSLQVISAIVRQRARAGSLSNPQAFLLEIADRIETVGQLHRLLSESATGEVQLAKYIREICQRLTGALAPEATSYSFQCPEEFSLPAKQALPLALITAELISNSLKYAHPAGLPTRITLSCNPGANGLEMAYEDDGVGFPEGFDASEAGHMGMRLIQTLSRGLGGDHEWRSDPLGIQFTMSVPIGRFAE